MKPVFGSVDPLTPSSSSRRRTGRAALSIAYHVHPVTKQPLLPPERNLHCRDCAHHYKSEIWHKCDQVKHTGGPATDIRVSWPACVLFSAKGGAP